MIKVSKNYYYSLLDNCRCSACICHESCFQAGLSFGNSKDCKDNTCLVSGSTQVIKNKKSEIESMYRY